MHAYETTAENGSVEQLDERDARALTQYLTVLFPVSMYGRRGESSYLVVSEFSDSYVVDVDGDGAECECEDATCRDPAGCCKHVRRVLFATGRRAIPAWVDRDAIDPDLGEHVLGNVRFADGEPDTAPAGGDIVEAGDEGEVLQEAGGDEDQDVDGRPDERDCGDWNADLDLSCWECYRAGFDDQNPDALTDDGEGGGRVTMLPVATIRTLVSRAEIKEGRVTVAAHDADAVLRVRDREHTPLGEGEAVAALSITGEGHKADIELTGGAVDALADVHEGDAGDA